MNSGKYLYSGTTIKKVPSSKKVAVSKINNRKINIDLLNIETTIEIHS